MSGKPQRLAETCRALLGAFLEEVDSLGSLLVAKRTQLGNLSGKSDQN